MHWLNYTSVVASQTTLNEILVQHKNPKNIIMHVIQLQTIQYIWTPGKSGRWVHKQINSLPPRLLINLLSLTNLYPYLLPIKVTIKPIRKDKRPQDETCIKYLSKSVIIWSSVGYQTLYIWHHLKKCASRNLAGLQQHCFINIITSYTPSCFAALLMLSFWKFSDQFVRYCVLWL